MKIHLDSTFIEMFFCPSGDSSESCFQLWVGREWLRSNQGDEPQETDLGGDPHTHSSREVQFLVCFSHIPFYICN